MPVVIDATVGGAAANSYITLAEAENYAQTELDISAWTGATTDRKNRSLVSATRYIDFLQFIGERASTTQALDWPRSDVETSERTYPSNAIPSEIKRATFDVALALLQEIVVVGKQKGTKSLIPGIPNDSLKRLKLDVMEIEWRTDAVSKVTPLVSLPWLRDQLGELLASQPSQVLSVVRS